MLKRIYLSVILVFFSLVFSASFLVYRVSAADPIPAPGRIPCGKEANPDFNSLRPYQASPCGDSPKAYYCTNAIIIYEGFHGTSKEQGLQPFNIFQPEKEYAVTISDTELPIYGNTEQVKNSQNDADEFDDATKLNEYVSWYLSGVNGRAEYGDVTQDQIVNFSGPVKKLLPSIIQDAQRLLTIESASKEVTFESSENTPSDSSETEEITGPTNVNQVVVCESGGKAVACPDGEELKLKNWGEGDLSIFNKILNWIPSVSIWDKKYPPLPWQFDEEIAYQKAYNEWRGKSCAVIPIINKLVCIENILVPNKWADLYQYVPLTNNSDKNAKMPIEGVQIEGRGGAEIDISDPKYKIIREPVNMFAHTQEDSENLDLLGKTYKPQGIEAEVDYDTVESGRTDANHCQIVDVRSNEGDNLFTDLSPSEVRVKVSSYTVTQLMCDEPITSCKRNKDPECTEEVITGYKCHGSAEIAIRSTLKSPYAKEIWESSTADSTSEFRKVYPKVEEGAPVSCIANIPGVSKAVYTPTDGTDEITVLGPNGKYDLQNAEIHFPFIGSVYEYFLKGIQTALRPKGYGETVVNGQYCNNIKCGELPETLTKASGSCELGGIDSRVGEVVPSLKAIVEAAAETYKVPPTLILGVMYGEGAFNSNQYQDEKNVKNWASCVPIPNCNEGASEIKSIVPFIKPYWDNLAKDILPDLQKIDPNKTNADPCNLLDATFGLAKDLHDNTGGGVDLAGKSCYGVTMGSTNPTSCSWNNSQYETSIRGWEFGAYYNPPQCDPAGSCTCATEPGSCAAGGGLGAGCPGDNCEKLGNSGNTSHNACVFDISTSGGSGNRN